MSKGFDMLVVKSILLILVELVLVPLIKLVDFLYRYLGLFPATRIMLKRFYYRKVRLFFYNF
ncbi:MAG: hypothetical protein D6748_13025 [Calditrichaeota bacterium]|nr:MAG: hypothetical protein D6748_13025 [Calditrichota bacterium]